MILQVMIGISNMNNIADDINWVQTGRGQSETVVLVHAIGQDLTYWDRQIECLASTYNVVAFDLPGHGRSRGIPQEWSFEMSTATVAKLIECVSALPVHLVGISFGGMIAQRLTIERPELVRSLTLIATAPRFSDEVRLEMRRRAETVREQGMSAILESTISRWFTADTRSRRPDIIDRITKTLLNDNPDIHAAIWDLISGHDTHTSLGRIQCPTIVMVGNQDPSTPPWVAEELASAIPGAKMIVIPNASHIVTVEAPGAVNEALKHFLKSLQGSA